MASVKRRLIIVFPGIFDLIANHDQEAFSSDCPNLASLVDRGHIEYDPDSTFERVIANACGIHLDDVNTLNIIELSARVDGLTDSSNLVRADPVHLRPDGVQLRLFNGRHFEPSADESANLLEELRVLFPDYEFHAGKFSGRWYVSLPEAVEFQAMPPSAVAQLAIDQRLPSGRDGKKIHALMNEIQMALYQSKVNQQREASGKSAVNSVWLWGRGETALVCESAAVTVWGDDVTASALTARCEIEHLHTISQPEGVAEIIRHPWRGQLKLVLLNQPTGPALERHQQMDLAQFEHAWAAPLLKYLRSGHVRLLEIVDMRRKLTISTLDSWKFWRRSSYFADRLRVDIDPAKITRDVSNDEP